MNLCGWLANRTEREIAVVGAAAIQANQSGFFFCVSRGKLFFDSVLLQTLSLESALQPTA